MTEDIRKIVVLGASSKPNRYSNMAIKLLKEKGFFVIPIRPSKNNNEKTEIEGFPVKNSLKEIRDKIETITVYIGPKNVVPLIDFIIKLNPKRVILNPGTECEFLEKKLTENKISFIKACTLVLLKTGQF